jgi:hypothetical protein
MKTQSIIRTSLSLVVLIALAIAAGCDKQKSGTADDAGRSGVKQITFDPKNPCTLLKKDEVEVFMKQKVMDLQPRDGFCSYWSREPKSISFEITMTTPDDPLGELKGIKKYMQKDGQKPGHVIKQVDGVGDDAFFQVIPREQEKYLYVVKGKYRFIFRTRGDKGYELSEAEVKILVKTALDRI